MITILPIGECHMAVPYPSLSAIGWVTDAAVKADKILCDFITANYSQTILFRGKIKSLAYYIQHQQSEHELEETLHLNITRLLEAYYDSCDVNIKITPIEVNGVVESDNRLDIRIDAIVVQDGTRYSLGKIVSVVNNKIGQILSI